MELGERIRQARQRAHLSQEKVAELIGVSRQAVTKWESGQSTPTTDNLCRLAEILETTVDLLIAPEDNSRSVAQEVYRMLKEEETKKAAQKRSELRKNCRTALLVLLIYGIIYLAEKLTGWNRTEMALLPWLIDTRSTRHRYLFGWLLHNGLFFCSCLLTVLPSLMGKRRLSLSCLAGFILGLLFGESFGQLPMLVAPGYHYGWLIWGGIYLACAAMGIWLQRMKEPSFSDWKLRLWLFIFLLIPTAITLLVLLGIPPYARN